MHSKSDPNPAKKMNFCLIPRKSKVSLPRIETKNTKDCNRMSVEPLLVVAGKFIGILRATSGSKGLCRLTACCLFLCIVYRRL